MYGKFARFTLLWRWEGVPLAQVESKPEQPPTLDGDKVQKPDAEQVATKYGLEAGLLQAWRNQGKGVTAKELLKRYGAAYLLTSISFALLTFSLCYLAVDRGIDVVDLLARINIGVGADSAGEKAGTLALAYAAHKALSPIRFPPTVALTPVVANWLRKSDPPGNQSNSDGKDN